MALKKVAFIGLGTMGMPMAINLVRAGFTVTGHNRSPHRVDTFVTEGGLRGETIAKATSEADVVITMLPDSPDVEAVLLGEEGVFAHARPGTLVIDMSTIRPDTARGVAVAGAERGLRVLDAPVSGGRTGAIEATLSIMVGGSDEDFDAARPVLDALGSTPVLVGPSGAGQTVKAANQLMAAGHLQLLAEALVFGMRERDFEPSFRAALHDKDMRIVTDSAREVGVAIPVGAQVAQLLAALKNQGDGGLDHSALLKLVEQLSGRDT